MIEKKKEILVYINGKYFPESDAKISVLDHGFLYGDGVFDTLVVYNGKIFKLDDHIERLYNSLKMVKIDAQMSKDELKKAIFNTLKRNKIRNAYVRVIVSRGKGYPLLDPRYCEEPTIVILPSELRHFLPSHREFKGLNVITTKVRKTPPICLDPRVKSNNYLNNILARIEAMEAEADEAIMLDIHGFIAEGTGDNVFMVKREVLYTPTLANILEGITRRTVIEIAEREGHRVVETDLTPYDLITADEVFLTSTAGGVIPILRIDGKIIGEGLEGAVTKKLRELYIKEVEEKGTEI